jgi:DNA-binding response OmpR family regulator
MDQRVLIVDDDESLCFLLRQALLQEFPDSQVDVAHSGEEGLSRLAESSYDLIIADIRMPGLDGLGLISAVRYLDASVPVIIMTGYGTESIRSEAASLAVQHYVDKPLRTADLLQVVHNLLSDQQAAV